MFKVEGKMFALSALDSDSLSVSLKCEPALAEALRAAHAAVTPRLPPEQAALEHRELGGSLPDGTVRDMIEDSYDLVVSKLPRAKRRALGWDGDA